MIMKCERTSETIYASINREFNEDNSLVSYKLNIHWDDNKFEENVDKLMADIQANGGVVIDVKYNTAYCSADIDYNYKNYNPVLDTVEPEKFPYMIYNALVIYEE